MMCNTGLMVIRICDRKSVLIVNRENMSNHKSRYMFSANLNYKIFDWMNVVGRMRVDNSNDVYERKIAASSDQLFASEYGNYMNMKSGYKTLTGMLWPRSINVGRIGDYGKLRG